MEAKTPLTATQSGTLIAVHLFVEHPPVVLARGIPAPFSEFKIDTLDLDFSRFVGGGWAMDIYVLTEEAEAADDAIVIAESNGIKQYFQFEEMCCSFPVIEGEVTPGIYHLELHPFEVESGYFLIHNNRDLSLAFSHFYDYCSPEEVKFVCRPDALEWRLMPDDVTVEKIACHVFTYFDIYCPLCRQQIIGFETLSETNPRGRIVETRCSHYIGVVFLTDGFYDGDAMDEIEIKYRWQDHDLYFETRDKKWEKVVVYEPNELTDSYWYDLKLSHIHHFLFSPSETVRKSGE